MDEFKRHYHESSSLFPMLEGDDFELLKEDIALNGLLEPIVVHPDDGSILDGRNRHRACLETNTEVRVKVWERTGSEVAYVTSLNLHRRHLTSSQRAAIALDILPLLEIEAAKRYAKNVGRPRKNDGKISVDFVESSTARRHAASIMNTNPRYVSDAKKMQESSPELLEQVRLGELSIPRAKQVLVKIERRRNATWDADQINRKKMVEEGLSVVANKKSDNALISWADDNGFYVEIDRRSIWGNPFIVDEDGTRDEVIEKYRWYYGMKNSLWHRLPVLKGKVLGCWCYPEACHGNHLVELVQGYVQGGLDGNR